MTMSHSLTFLFIYFLFFCQIWINILQWGPKALLVASSYCVIATVLYYTHFKIAKTGSFVFVPSTYSVGTGFFIYFFNGDISVSRRATRMVHLVKQPDHNNKYKAANKINGIFDQQAVDRLRMSLWAREHLCLCVSVSQVYQPVDVASLTSSYILWNRERGSKVSLDKCPGAVTHTHAHTHTRTKTPATCILDRNTL